MNHLSGEEAEAYYFQAFADFFSAPSLRLTSKYSIFDYISIKDRVAIELKSRTVKHDQYPTTMVPISKVNRAIALRDDGYRVVFAFNFLDGVYYVDFTENMKYTVKKGGRVDRGRPEIGDYAYIPIGALTPASLDQTLLGTHTGQALEHSAP